MKTLIFLQLFIWSLCCADLYPNNLKSWEFDKEALEVEAGEANGETAKLKKFSDAGGPQIQGQPTPSKPNFSGCLGIYEKEFVFIVPSYNNEKWAKTNILSLIRQNYEKFRVIYINDCSSDETGTIVKKLAKEIPGRTFQSLYFSKKEGEGITNMVDRFKKLVNDQSAFFTLVTNTQRCGALENIYKAVHSCANHEIIAIVDGDDWLAHHNVLRTLNEIYSSNEVWMTHGKLIEYPNGQTFWCQPVPDEVIAANSLRQFRCPSHLRTFYCWLFKKISIKDLTINETFFSVTGDMAVMFPITEMAGKHQFFINEVNYVYNVENPLNDNKVATDLQNTIDFHIRHLPPYKPLEKPDN